ncbi:protein DpdG [Bradyrhizobium sp. CB1015]|uniref:protein DpdG n=1 Tax=Bradyrhizobium sp. CB1015 TaxID=2976822 RepID=UPI0021AAA07C|nr:protein DpdG [Bradyrhizobium sp. CB1015]UWU92945.1 protein DpdG [Bradyrhizobium sp. CB1015]
MSIITTAPAVPNRVLALYASLLASPTGDRKQRFESLATPPSIHGRGASEEGEGTTTLFSSTIREAKLLGIFEEDEERIKVSEEARSKGTKRDPEARLKSHLIRVLFDPERAEEAKQRGFMTALAWFLRQNPLVPMEFGAPPQSEIAKDLGEHAHRTELTNLNTWQNFVYWARFLGFATMTGSKESKWVVPDPMHAIRDVLTDVFGEDEELPIDAMMAGLARIYPVFEGGDVRREVEDWSSAVPESPSERRLSVATSLALQRLHTKGRISLIARADASSAIMPLGTSERRVSHVRLGAAK